jgi:hypothetical protein
MTKWWNNRISWLNTELKKSEVLPKSKDFGTITKDDDYPEITSQTFTLISYDRMTSLAASLEDGYSSAFEITNDFRLLEAEKEVYQATVTVKLKNKLSLGTYSDELILRYRNNGSLYYLSVPLRFAVTKLEQELFLLDEVEDKSVEDENFFLTTTGGSGTGAVTFTLISGNAIVDEDTGEVEITGTGDIVVVAIKAEDNDYQLATSQELTINVSDPTGISRFVKPSPLRIWVQNGLLHIAGITPGETVSVHNITGTLIYNNITTSDTIDIPLRAQGVYVVKAGRHTVRVISYDYLN